MYCRLIICIYFVGLHCTVLSPCGASVTPCIDTRIYLEPPPTTPFLNWSHFLIIGPLLYILLVVEGTSGCVRVSYRRCTYVRCGETDGPRCFRSAGRPVALVSRQIFCWSLPYSSRSSSPFQEVMLRNRKSSCHPCF